MSVIKKLKGYALPALLVGGIAIGASGNSDATITEAPAEKIEDSDSATAITEDITNNEYYSDIIAPVLETTSDATGVDITPSGIVEGLKKPENKVIIKNMFKEASKQCQEVIRQLAEVFHAKEITSGIKEDFGENYNSENDNSIESYDSFEEKANEKY